MTQNVYCEYQIEDWLDGSEFYTCKVEDVKISQHCELNFIGDHEDYHTNLDIEQVDFFNCTISRVPQGLTKVFPNLKVINIDNSKLKEVRREDLQEYSELTDFYFPNIDIEFLSGDLFMDMKNLEDLSFERNKIKIIQPNLFDGLEKLDSIDLEGNPCIDENCNPECACWNLTLNELKNKIREKFSGPSWDLVFQKFKNFNQENKSKRKLLSNDELKSKYMNGVSGDLTKIIQNEKLKDFVVKVDDEEFKVHKLLLAARSPVFAQMIENNIDAEELNLTDITVDIFCEILNFIYTDECPTSNDLNYVKLFAAAGRLKIEKLKEFAAEKSIDKINEENALEILMLANKYENDNLRQKSFEIIKNKCFNNKDVAVADNLIHQPDKLSKLIEIQKKKEKIKRKMEEMLKAVDLEFQTMMNEN